MLKEATPRGGNSITQDILGFQEQGAAIAIKTTTPTYSSSRCIHLSTTK
jgi:hypothetical protein